MKCELRMQQNELLHAVIGVNANVSLDKKSLHIHGQRRVAHAAWRKNYASPLISFVVHIRCSHSDYVQVESRIFTKDQLIINMHILRLWRTNGSSNVQI